ncbi:hypothetical protein O0F56_01850 [Staphylococcus pseudintermedius]|nr:hypothetical protein [Staphylococcus pseudintermedius]EGQ1626005.1 hypothetical protein [Staphylococcus pseudintermedius]EIA5782154.1 hypothetical protein [Staphylococcus pseudintermedius]EJD5784260.1 hypothetical protein [Staphylococcus pseudintermedius]EKO1090423.1 hypothetical protein [Staphylococcus pseudintermedius]
MENTKTYTEFKEEQRQKFEALPIQYFLSENIETICKKMEVASPKDLIKIGGFGVMKKSNKYLINNYLLDKQKEFQKLMQSDEFALNAFKYELANHEFVITYDYEDALDALELEYSELDSRLLNLLKKAKEQYLKEFDEYSY